VIPDPALGVSNPEGYAKGHAINVLVFGTTHFQAWTKDDTLRSLIPDPANSVVAVFSGADADRFRAIVGMPRTAP
jgi:hypothetical protein